MKLSVLMITYNHEKYIAQALDSVLMQELDFEYEIIIGEDCSTDNTRNIVLEYQQKYPNIVKALFPEKNLGAPQNFLACFNACKGEYIALLEGDDYWTSPHKLQKQVDILDNNPDFSICFHNMKVIYENGSKETHFSNVNQKEVSTIYDLANRNFIYTASCTFRNGLFGNLPAWFDKAPIVDWMLHLLNAKYGNIYYIDDVMGVYRVHDGGIWECKNIRYKQEKMAEFGEVLFDKFDDDINNIFRRNQALGCYDLGLNLFIEGNHEKAQYYLYKCVNADILQIYNKQLDQIRKTNYGFNTFDYILGHALLSPYRSTVKLLKVLYNSIKW